MHGEMMYTINKNVLKALLAHAKYSFEDIGWNFEKLTLKEKCLMKNQETLNKIKEELENSC